MARHFHRSRGVASVLSPLADVIGSAPPESSRVLDFSPFLKQSIHEAVLIRLRDAGFECDEDLAGLLPAELELTLKGFIDDEEAGWYIELAQGASRRAKRQQCDVEMSHFQPQPEAKKRLKPAVMSAKFCTFQLAQAATVPNVLRPCRGQAEMIDSCWAIYQALGSRGGLWSPLMESDPAAAKDVFSRKLRVFEEKSLGSRLSCLRRWSHFLTKQGLSQELLLFPSASAVNAFLRDVNGGGPTAAASVFQKLLWWKRCIGLPFPLDDPLLGVWNRPCESHSVRQRQPLSILAVQILCELAVGAYTNLATFASLALIPLAGCLRFAHVQRSGNVRLDHGMLRAVCCEGKSRKRGVRPAFEWAAPLHVGSWNDALGLAVRTILALQRDQPTLSFCIPDLSLASGRLDENGTWGRKRMPIQKFVDLLRSVLTGAGMASSEVQAVSTYSLRRFLPSVAEVVRTPPEVARHLGNWSESVTLKHQNREPMHMAELYAHDRVLTAARSKSILLQVVCQVVRDTPKNVNITLQTIAQSGWTWQKALSRFVEIDTADAGHHQPVELAGCVASEDSASSEETSCTSEYDADLGWFRLAKGVAHLTRVACKVTPTPYCRQNPFPNAISEWGRGIAPDLDVCSKCLASAPSHIARAVRALRDQAP